MMTSFVYNRESTNAKQVGMTLITHAGKANGEEEGGFDGDKYNMQTTG